MLRDPKAFKFPYVCKYGRAVGNILLKYQQDTGDTVHAFFVEDGSEAPLAGSDGREMRCYSCCS